MLRAQGTRVLSLVAALQKLFQKPGLGSSFSSRRGSSPWRGEGGAGTSTPPCLRLLSRIHFFLHRTHEQFAPVSPMNAGFSPRTYPVEGCHAEAGFFLFSPHILHYAGGPLATSESSPNIRHNLTGCRFDHRQDRGLVSIHSSFFPAEPLRFSPYTDHVLDAKAILCIGTVGN